MALKGLLARLSAWKVLLLAKCASKRKETQPKRPALVPRSIIKIQTLCLLPQLCKTPALMVPPIPCTTDKTILTPCNSLEHDSCPHFPPPPPAFSFLCLSVKCLALLLLPFLPPHPANNMHWEQGPGGNTCKSPRLTCEFYPTYSPLVQNRESIAHDWLTQHQEPRTLILLLITSPCTLTISGMGNRTGDSKHFNISNGKDLFGTGKSVRLGGLGGLLQIKQLHDSRKKYYFQSVDTYRFLPPFFPR